MLHVTSKIGVVQDVEVPSKCIRDLYLWSRFDKDLLGFILGPMIMTER